jgi:hypothetical protein
MLANTIFWGQYQALGNTGLTTLTNRLAFLQHIDKLIKFFVRQWLHGTQNIVKGSLPIEILFFVPIKGAGT